MQQRWAQGTVAPIRMHPNFAQSTRFFIRAIDTYDEGLKSFPLSFDLAYNKCVSVRSNAF